MKLIVGLGNPGDLYKHTRHNAGFRAVDYLAQYFGFEPFRKSDKHKAALAKGQVGAEEVLLAKPQTFMNRSGEAVQSLCHFYKISPENLILIFDDADLPSGSLRIRPSGSAGGHKGVQSIFQSLGAENFIRVRLGIAPLPEFQGALEDYVLGRFTKEEEESLKNNLDRLPELIWCLIEKGAEEAMGKFN